MLGLRSCLKGVKAGTRTPRKVDWGINFPGYLNLQNRAEDLTYYKPLKTRIIIKFSIIIFLSVALACCGGDGSDSNPSPEISTTECSTFGWGLFCTFNHNGSAREYILYVPQSYDDNEAVPLLFNFHGYGGNAERQLWYADFRDLAEEEKGSD